MGSITVKEESKFLFHCTTIFRKSCLSLKCFEKLETLSIHEYYDPCIKNLKTLKVLNVLNLKSIKFIKNNMCNSVTDLMFENCNLSELEIGDFLNELKLEQLSFKKCVLPFAKNNFYKFEKLKVLEIVECKEKSAFDYFLGAVEAKLEKLDVSNTYLERSLEKIVQRFNAVPFLSVKGHDLKKVKFGKQKIVNVCQCIGKNAGDVDFGGKLIVEMTKMDFYQKKFPKASLLFE